VIKIVVNSLKLRFLSEYIRLLFTALDPAGPLFACGSLGMRLDHMDARLVQVLHTNGMKLSQAGLGTLAPMGHVDFYVNGGQEQPFCPEAPIRSAVKNLLTFQCKFCISNYAILYFHIKHKRE